MEHQEKEIARLREVLRKVTFEISGRRAEEAKRDKVLREYEALAREMEERKVSNFDREREREVERSRGEVEKNVRKFVGVKHLKIWEELNELFDRVVEKERTRQRTLLAANDLLTKRKEPNLKQKKKKKKKKKLKKRLNNPPVGEKKKGSRSAGIVGEREKDASRSTSTRSVLLFIENAIKNTML